MEKNQNLLDLKYQDLLWRIVGAVRRQTRTMPAFRDSHNGCIRITIVPLTQNADTWLGGGTSSFGEFPEVNIADVCEREFVYKIDPRGSHTIQYVCDDGHTEPVNCYGYSALKTAYVSWKRKFDDAVRKGLGETFSDFQFHQSTQFFSEDNGWSTCDGSVCTTVTLDGDDFCRLYVCTSGATAKEDKACSLAGILAAQEYFEHYFKAAKCNPRIDDKESPLEQVWCD